MQIHSQASLSGLRILALLQASVQIKGVTRIQVAVAVAQACSFNSNSTPSPRTSICCRYSHKEKKNYKYKIRNKLRIQTYRYIKEITTNFKFQKAINITNITKPRKKTIIFLFECLTYFYNISPTFLCFPIWQSYKIIYGRGTEEQFNRSSNTAD